MSDRADEIAQEFVPANAPKVMVDTRSGDRQIYSAEEWHEHIAAAHRDYAEEARREERSIAAQDAEMRYEDGYACGLKDEREACARLAEAAHGAGAHMSHNRVIAAAIRARGEGKG